MCFSIRFVLCTLVALYISTTGIEGICKDSISDKNFITVDNTDNTTDQVTDCGQLVSQHPKLCRKRVGRRKCCQSCLNSETCIDDLPQRKRAIRIRDDSGNIIDKVRNCNRLVEKYPYKCNKSNVKWKRCCRSCRRLQNLEQVTTVTENTATVQPTTEAGNINVEAISQKIIVSDVETEISFPNKLSKRAKKKLDQLNKDKTDLDENCQDTLTETNTHYVLGEDREFIDIGTDCEVMTKMYPAVCKDRFAKPLCCQSCKNVDLSCIDNALKVWVVRGVVMTCKELVAQDICRCHEVLHDVDIHCCQTCKNTDTEPCFCQDKLSKYFTVKIPVTNENTGKTKEIEISNCADIVNNHVEYCALGPGGLGGRTNKCCKSCKDKCVDSPVFNTTVRAGDQTCNNCSCKQLRDSGEELLRTACENKKIKDICCKSCKQSDS